MLKLRAPASADSHFLPGTASLARAVISPPHSSNRSIETETGQMAARSIRGRSTRTSCGTPAQPSGSTRAWVISACIRATPPRRSPPSSTTPTSTVSRSGPGTPASPPPTFTIGVAPDPRKARRSGASTCRHVRSRGNARMPQRVGKSTTEQREWNCELVASPPSRTWESRGSGGRLAPDELQNDHA